VIWKVTSLLRRMAPVSEIEAVIQYDQAIAAKVLTLSRSAYYARRYTIGSLKDAIVALGDQQLTRVVMTACAARYFETEISGYEIREGQLWKHSVATALLAETAARRLGEKKVLTVYTAGLLHDIGKAVLSFYVKTYLDAILVQMSRKGLDLLEAERDTLGMDHQQLGQLLAKRWRFPPEVIAGIGCHHCPSKAKAHHDVAAAVYVANRTAVAMGYGCGMESLVESYEQDIFGLLGIQPSMVGQFWKDMAGVCDQIEDVVSEESSMFSSTEAKTPRPAIRKAS
ncbi:MAG: HDOD domain-containing protein, partial [Deltaproteobacteria bacterium]|nr:HDOD domain-containing protein [Deltaproteobacteria bacterium]